jgi:hypothetical protein
MRYKLDTAHGKATIRDKCRVMVYGLDIQDAEKIVEALNFLEPIDRKTAAEIADIIWIPVSITDTEDFSRHLALNREVEARLLPRYPEPDDHVT